MTSTPTPADALCAATNLRYLAAGGGERAVVLVHGWGAFKEIWWSTLVALAPHARAYAPDLPGHGGSTAAPPAGEMRQLAAQIGAFCEARGLAGATLVGHSMGGNIAVELALARPDLVGRLVLVNPAVQGSEMPAYTRSYLRSAGGWLALRASIALARGVSPLGERVPHAHGGGLLWPTLRRTSYMARHDPELLHRLLGALFRNPLLPRLPGVTQPTLVIAGQFDPLVPAGLSRRVSAAIPGARYALMPRCAHNPMDEQPAAFAELLVEFVRGGGGRGA